MMARKTRTPSAFDTLCDRFAEATGQTAASVLNGAKYGPSDEWAEKPRTFKRACRLCTVLALNSPADVPDTVTCQAIWQADVLAHAALPKGRKALYGKSPVRAAVASFLGIDLEAIDAGNAARKAGPVTRTQIGPDPRVTALESQMAQMAQMIALQTETLAALTAALTAKPTNGKAKAKAA